MSHGKITLRLSRKPSTDRGGSSVVAGMGPPSVPTPSATAWDRAARVPIANYATRTRAPPPSSRGGLCRRPAWNSETMRDANEYRLPPEEMLRRKALLQPKHTHHAFTPTATRSKTTTTSTKKKKDKDKDKPQAYDPSKYTQQSASVSVGSSAPSLSSSPRCASRLFQSSSSLPRGTRVERQQQQQEEQACMGPQEAVAGLEARLATLMLTNINDTPQHKTHTQTQQQSVGSGSEGEELMRGLTELMRLIEHEAQHRQELSHRLERVEATLGTLLTRHKAHQHPHTPSLHSSSGGSSSASSERLVLVDEDDEEEALRPCKRLELSPLKASASPTPNHTRPDKACPPSTCMPPPRRPTAALVGVWRPPSNKTQLPPPLSE